MPETMEQVDGKKVFAKIAWRLIPYIFILYILAYLDRVNVGFAALEMKRDLSLSDTVYGTGAGIFFLGSSLFDLPSNLLLQKVGPRRWIARIMITWGIIATCMMFVKGAHSFYAMRFFLGVSEAGFFPGMILYLTYWFPSRERARAVATFMTATAIAGVVGAPISSSLLKLEGTMHLHGWQWLFLVEGIPTFLMGISVLFMLKDRPDDATWLTEPEKKWLDEELERDQKAGGASEHHSLKDAFKNKMVWVLAGIFFLDQVGIYTVNLWMPLILNSFMHGTGAATGSAISPADASHIAKFATVPYAAAAIFMVLIGWTSDRSGERRWHIAGCLLLSALGFGWAGAAHSLSAALIAMTLAAVGYWSIMGPFWALPTRILSGPAAAGGVAIITMVGGVGGFLGPYLTGRLKDLTHGYSGGLYTIAGLAVLGAALCAALAKPKEDAA
ncbi:MFS transporter [Granulicella arctica]|uniref:MFS transporter n=1 Tax=Granulicella arctica TaxID=940613 RepID=UPI0021DFA99B|nr:MFS transporter [Granulicella arctica]